MSILSKIKEMLFSNRANRDNDDNEDSSHILTDDSDLMECEIDFEESKETSEFYNLSDIIEHGSDIHDRIKACEKSLELLPGFVNTYLEMDGELPPYILCRDKAPLLYMQIGEWDKAIETVKYCIQINAFFPPEEGQEALEYCQNYQKTAEKIILFLREHPGFLQKDIYKTANLDESEKPNARHFCRYSLLLRKEPYGKTYRLYVK